AVERCERMMDGHNLPPHSPRIAIIITGNRSLASVWQKCHASGDGQLRGHYERRFSSINCGRFAFHTTWLELGDYMELLGKNRRLLQAALSKPERTLESACTTPRRESTCQ